MEDLQNVNTKRIATEEFLDENDNVFGKNKINYENVSYKIHFYQGLNDKDLLTCDNMNSEVNILGIETERLCTPRELEEENNFVDENNNLETEDFKEFTNKSNSKIISIIEINNEKSVDNTNIDIQHKTKPPMPKSNNNSLSSCFINTTSTNSQFSKRKLGHSMISNRNEIGNLAENLFDTPKIKKKDKIIKEEKIIRNLDLNPKKIITIAEKTRNNNSLLDSKLSKRNTNTNKSIDKSKSKNNSQKDINNPSFSYNGTPKNKNEKNRRSLELKKNKIDKNITVEINHNNQIVNKIPHSSRVKQMT